MPATPKDHERISLSLLVFIAIFFIVAFLRPILSDGDSWWHLAAGKWIVEHRQIPSADPFSYSRPGAPWHAHEWLSEVLMWLAFKFGGWEALVGLTAFVAGLAAAIFCYAIRRFLPPVAAIAITMVVALAMLPSAWVRPHLLVLPILLLWLIGLLTARDKGRAPPWALAALMVVWANMHASFLLGLVMIGPLACEAVLEAADRRKAILGWAGFAALAVAASLITPFGINGFVYPLQVSSMRTLENIQEWMPTVLAKAPVFLALLFALLLAFMLLGAKFRPFRALLFLLFLYLAFAHRRHQFLFGFLGTLLAAEPIGEALGRRQVAPRVASGLDRAFLQVLLLSAAVMLAARLAIPVDVDQRHGQPIAAIAHVPAGLRDKPVFNHYNFGGPLIFSGIKPFIDGRADMYGDDFFADYLAAERAEPAALARIFRRYDVQWAILPPKSPLVAALDARGWRRLYADKRAVIQARQSSSD